MTEPSYAPCCSHGSSSSLCVYEEEVGVVGVGEGKGKNISSEKASHLNKSFKHPSFKAAISVQTVFTIKTQGSTITIDTLHAASSSE